MDLVQQRVAAQDTKLSALDAKIAELEDKVQELHIHDDSVDRCLKMRDFYIERIAKADEEKLALIRQQNVLLGKLQPPAEEQSPAGGGNVEGQELVAGLQSAAVNDDFLKSLGTMLEPVLMAAKYHMPQQFPSYVDTSSVLQARQMFRTTLNVTETDQADFARSLYPVLHGYMAPNRVDPNFQEEIKAWCHAKGGLELVNAQNRCVWSSDSSLAVSEASTNKYLVIPSNYHSNPALGSILGIEVYDYISEHYLQQAELRFYLMAGYSNLPFVQLITDTQKGGAAFYCSGTTSAGKHIKQQVLIRKEAIQNFIKFLINSIPDDLLAGEAGDLRQLPSRLADPERVRFRRF